MSWVMIRGTSSWRLRRWSGCRDCTPAKGLNDSIRTRLWIDRQNDPLVMYGLRRSTFTPPGVHSHLMTDDEVARAVSHQIGSGLLQVCEKEIPLLNRPTDGHSVSEMPLEETTAPSRSAARTPAPTPVAKQPEPASFGKEADLVALAAVLTAAAESGTPFCEECAKAAAGEK